MYFKSLRIIHSYFKIALRHLRWFDETESEIFLSLIEKRWHGFCKKSLKMFIFIVILQFNLLFFYWMKLYVRYNLIKKMYSLLVSIKLFLWQLLLYITSIWTKIRDQKRRIQAFPEIRNSYCLHKIDKIWPILT